MRRACVNFDVCGRVVLSMSVFAACAESLCVCLYMHGVAQVFFAELQRIRETTAKRPARAADAGRARADRESERDATTPGSVERHVM